MSSRRRRRRVRDEDYDDEEDLDASELARRRERYLEAVYDEGCECCCSECCECCNYRCWAIFISVLALITSAAMIIFGAWAIDGWKYGMAFGLAILVVAVISLFLISVSLYGVVHGYAKYIFVGVIFAGIKVTHDIIYGVLLGMWINAEYMVGAIYQVMCDAFILWILWRCYKIAQSVED